VVYIRFIQKYLQTQCGLSDLSGKTRMKQYSCTKHTHSV